MVHQQVALQMMHIPMYMTPVILYLHSDEIQSSRVLLPFFKQPHPQEVIVHIQLLVINWCLNELEIPTGFLKLI
jgi:hypothetical protein